MKPPIIWLAFVLTAILQSASVGGGSSLPHHRLLKGEDLIPFESVARGDSLNSELATKEGLDAPSVVVARDRTEAECLIRLLNPSAAKQVTVEQIKKVDFNCEWVVAVVRGRMSSGGFGIGVERISRTPAGVSVSVKLTNPDPGVFQQQNMPHPFHIVRVPRGKIDIDAKSVWVVRTTGGQLLTLTGVAPSCPPSNNGMHPTADTADVIKRNRAGGRVMRGVRRGEGAYSSPFLGT